ncbi:tetratricopeptide repeat protein [Fodinibius sp. AD559]|uniref:tetratricopeptide repeat protein n=1 Tax=Fodinibius sp. AD559 TaxID=3424179 RepID=UPI004046BD37
MSQQVSAQDSTQFDKIRQSIETAVDSLQPERLIGLNTKLKTLTQTGDPEIKKYAYYYLGYSNYRLQNSFPQINEDQQEKYLDEATGMFEKAVEIDREFAEAYAMLGSCYGMKASGIFSGMKYGPKSDNAMSKAKELAPANPRIVMLDAIGKLYKPSMFGGSIEGAIEGFKRAAELFEDWQRPNTYAPRWGEAEVYAWLGQGYVKAEKYEEARQAYRKALEVKPGFPWVKNMLLPELEEKSE